MLTLNDVLQSLVHNGCDTDGHWEAPASNKSTIKSMHQKYQILLKLPGNMLLRLMDAVPGNCLTFLKQCIMCWWLHSQCFGEPACFGCISMNSPCPVADLLQQPS